MENKLKLTKDIAFLRSSIHIIEKGLVDEKRINETKKNFESLKNYLSADEKDWGNRILYDIDESIEYKGLYDRTDLLNNMGRRRSIRKFSGPIKDTDFINIIDSANYAPSSCNRQPMEYMLIKEAPTIQGIGIIKSQKFIEKAPTIILALCNTDVYWKQKENIPYFIFMDSGAAVQNLVLAANYYDIGTCIVNVSFKESHLIKNLLSIPHEFRVSAIIPCGTYNHRIKMPGRKSLSDMIHFEKFGGQMKNSNQKE